MTPLRALMLSAIEADRRVTARSLREIAEAAGIHPKTLSQRREPDSATLAKVLDALGYDLVLTRRDHATASDPGSP